MRPVVFVSLFLVLFGGAQAPAHAYAEDGHYYLKFLLAIRISCFTWDEARLIASGDLAADSNDSTVAKKTGTLSRGDNELFHAFGSDSEFEKAKDSLWKAMENAASAAGSAAHAEALAAGKYDELSTEARRLRDAGKNDEALAKYEEASKVFEDAQKKKKAAELEVLLARFGLYLHAVEDRFSHKGYDVTTGHAFDTVSGNDPDSLRDGSGGKAGDPERTTFKMAEATLREMARMCTFLDRSAEAVADILAEAEFKKLIQDLSNQSDPAWRKGQTDGGLTDAGKEVLKNNIKRMEQYLAWYLGQLNEEKQQVKKLPDDPSKIPPPIPITYDTLGNPKQIGDNKHTIFGRLPGSAAGDAVLASATLRIFSGGTRVETTVANRSRVQTSAGWLDVLAIDTRTNRMLAVTRAPLSPIAPGASAKISVDLPCVPRTSNVLVQVSAQLEDANARNNVRFVIPRR